MTYVNPRSWTGVSQSTNAPHPAGFIVYINGIEVPAKSVSQRYGVWQIPEMQIEMVADPVLTRLGAEDRVQVVVFYLDDVQPDPSVKPQFRLFGEGEIVAWGYQNMPGGRSIVFTVANQFVVLRQLLVQFLTQVDDYAANAVQLNPSLIGQATSEILFPFSLFTDGLLRSTPAKVKSEAAAASTEPGPTTTVEQGAADEAIELLAKAAGTGDYQLISKAYKEAKEKAEAASEVVQAAEAAKAAKEAEAAAAAGTSVPSTHMPNQIKRPFDYLYNVVKSMLEKKIPSAVRTVPAANFFARWARLTNFPNRFAAFPYFDDVEDNNVFPVLKALQGINALDVLVRKLLPQMQTAGSLFDMLQLVYQQVFMEIAMIPTMPLVKTDLLTGAIEETPFEEHVLVQDTTNTKRYITKKALVPLKPNRIPNYFSKPQFLFSIPPSCNVIFPSQIKMLSYRENYQEQPTRLYFNDEVVTNLLASQGINQVMISNALSTGYPDEVDVNNQLRLGGANVNGKNFLLYPEEFFRGPVMDRRNIPPWLFFLKQYQDSLQNSPAPGATPDGTPKSFMGVSVPGANAATASTSNVKAGATYTDADGSMAGFVWPMALASGGRKPVTLCDYRAHMNRALKGPKKDPKTGQVYYGRMINGKIKNEATTAGVDLYYWRMLPDGTFGNRISRNYSADGPEPYLPESKRPAGYVQDFHYYKNLAVPYGTMVLACGPGEVISAGDHGVGFSVKIRHTGTNWITYYTHMLKGSGKVQKGSKVVAGTPLGLLWYSPRDTSKVMHLHFSLYHVNSGGLAIDPAPFMAKWNIIGAPKLPTTGKANLPATSSVAQPPPPPTPTSAEPPTIDPELWTRLKGEEESVYKLYAKYEYYRERYAARSGTAHLSWNPYVVPGFPAVFFDQRSTRVDVFAYITTVQQRMTHRERATDITYVYGRTIQEVFGLLRHEFDGGSYQLGNAPQEPVKDIRKIGQDFTKAESMYQRLFYGARRLYNKDASFDFRKVLAFAPDNPAGLPEPIYVTGQDTASNDAYDAASQIILAKKPEIERLQAERLAAQQKWDAASAVIAEIDEPSVWDGEDPQSLSGLAQKSYEEYVLPLAPYRLKQAQADMDEADQIIAGVERDLARLTAGLTESVDTVKATIAEVDVGSVGVTSNVRGDREVVPLSSAEPMFQEYDSAMAYNWRPICTLDEYIIFHDAAGEGVIPAAGHERSVGARYFTRIRRMTPLTPAYKFPRGADGMTIPPDPPVGIGPTDPASLENVRAYLAATRPSEKELGLLPSMEAAFFKSAKAAGIADSLAKQGWADYMAAKYTNVATTFFSKSKPGPTQEEISGGLISEDDQIGRMSVADWMRQRIETIRLTALAAVAGEEYDAEAEAAAKAAAEAEATKDMRRVPGLHSGSSKDAPNEFPQTRADWDTILLAYRNNVYNVKAPKP